MEKFIAIIMAVFAAPLLIGGTYLLSLGGSAYYVIAGITMLVTAFLLFKRHWSAYRLYTIFIIATLAWALWESGFYWWALATRLGFPLIFGLLMLLPWVSNKMQGNKTRVSKSSDKNLVANGTSSLHSENLITTPFKDAKNNSKTLFIIGDCWLVWLWAH